MRKTTRRLVGALMLAGAVTAVYLDRTALTDKRVINCVWKAGEASPVGDVLAFDHSEIQLISGVLYRNGKSIGKITGRTSRFLSDDHIAVLNPETGISGNYYEKGCR
jgi:hypothetical protein